MLLLNSPCIPCSVRHSSRRCIVGVPQAFSAYAKEAKEAPAEGITSGAGVLARAAH